MSKISYSENYYEIVKKIFISTTCTDDGVGLLKNMSLHVGNMKRHTSNSRAVQLRRILSIKACLKDFEQQLSEAEKIILNCDD